MKTYDYLEAVKEDVKAWIEEHEEWKADYDDNRNDIEDDLNERLFVEDCVTGNASGSYTFNRWQAEENLCHNLDLLGEALAEFGFEPNSVIEQGAEACDVTIRCYLLGQAIGEVLDEIKG